MRKLGENKKTIQTHSSTAQYIAGLMPLVLMRELRVRRTLRLYTTAATLTAAFLVASRSPVATAFLTASSSLASTTAHYGGTDEKYKLNMFFNLLPSTTVRVGKQARESTTTRSRPISTLLMTLSSIVPATSALSVAGIDSEMASTTWAIDAFGDTVTNHAPHTGAGTTIVLADAAELLSAAGLDLNVKLGLAAFAGIGVAAAAFKTAVYWRMQYVVSASYPVP